MALAEADNACVGGHSAEGLFAGRKGQIAAIEGAGTRVSNTRGVKGGGVPEWERQDCAGGVEGPDEVGGGDGGENIDIID